MRSHNDGRGTKSGTNQGTKRWRRKKLEEVTAKARVVTARNGPEMRNAGRPIRKAAPAATSAPAGTARNRSQPWATSSVPVAAPPKPTRAQCPSDRWPAQPVSTTSETATMP